MGMTVIEKILAAHTGKPKVAPGDIVDVGTAHTAWAVAYPAHSTAQAAAQAARQTKDDARSTLETAIRSLTRSLQASASVDDTERQALGITVPDTVATAAAVPATRPLLTVDTSQRLRHVITFVDEGAPTKKAKPKGMNTTTLAKQGPNYRDYRQRWQDFYQGDAANFAGVLWQSSCLDCIL